MMNPKTTDDNGKGRYVLLRGVVVTGGEGGVGALMFVWVATIPRLPFGAEAKVGGRKRERGGGFEAVRSV